MKNNSKWQQYGGTLLIVIMLLAGWQWTVMKGYIADYLLPSLSQIAKVLSINRQLLWMHFKTTLYEALVGMSLGVGLGTLLAVVMEWVPFLNRSIYPLLIISQTIPTVAIAPMLVLWSGYGILPKVLLVILTTFFQLQSVYLKDFTP